MSKGSEKTETARIEAFSDGVFAIAITLLGLGLRAPVQDDASLGASLLAGWPSYVAFFTSFITIAIIWINHHRLFTHIYRVDHALLLLNGLLLMTVTVVPFGTTVLAEHLGRSDQQTAAILYTGVFIAVTGTFNLLWRHAARRHRLIDQVVDQRMIRRINLQYGFGPVLYTVSCCLALAAPWASVGADLLLAAFFSLPVLNWTRATGAGIVQEPE